MAVALVNPGQPRTFTEHPSALLCGIPLNHAVRKHVATVSNPPAPVVPMTSTLIRLSGWASEPTRGVVAWLASQERAWITGQVIDAEGGFRP